jgi:hypothetical protein
VKAQRLVPWQTVTECFTAVSGINAVTKPFLDLLDDRRIDIAQVEALISLPERLAEVVGKGPVHDAVPTQNSPIFPP